ncbi:hypothetical protein M422DRAFT_259301 [Sphaerobolus stellatus SS14]|uniref:Uncharacterized protein n=1 Tax=Sphaerobolus stellatus (strain SS14) TaxID=990650 RepID=A0A0C9V9B9_SPHS4|nr:hypothetical protein M422DRAFT_259301 [Sphaerobolus stellatus SS14]
MQRWCEWCQSVQSYQHFDKHVKACKPLHQPLRIPPRSQSSQKAQNSKASNIVFNVIPTVETILDPKKDQYGVEIEIPQQNEDSNAGSFSPQTQNSDIESEDGPEPEID